MPGFAYRLFLADGTDVGEASYAVVIRPDDVIHVERGGRMRVLAVVPVPEEESRYSGFLKVGPGLKTRVAFNQAYSRADFRSRRSKPKPRRLAANPLLG
jgi:hypothetical protein